MDRGRPGPKWASGRLPRTRGDGPVTGSPVATSGRASPHTRGWTRRPLGVPRLDDGFPAHAGMDRSPPTPMLDGPRLPRTRGDGPRAAGRGQEGVWASPHTRGWTPLRRCAGDRRDGFPAHAGMDPRTAQRKRHRARLPRTRGDGPASVCGSRGGYRASPHTRGWTHVVPLADLVRVGFPAHAGMDPAAPRSHPFRAGLPRTRGDGPCTARRSRRAPRASPHTRGWTRHHLEMASRKGTFVAT